MHTLEEVRREYDRLDALIGIDTSAIELKISKRAVRQLGSFRCPAKPGTAPLWITLSALILDDDERFWDTVRHEYAHAAAYLLYPQERHGHDRVWRELCRRIGCSPTRLAPENGRAAELRQEKVKYIIRCQHCGKECGYIRRGKAVDMMMSGRKRFLRCSACGSDRLMLLIREK